MLIKVLSDLHVEFEPYNDVSNLPVDVLVLAGDINVGRTNTKKTLRYFAERYPHVVYVMGNHEPYGGSIKDWSELGPLPKNVHFLNPGYVVIDDVVFIGACLWTDFGGDPFAEDAARRGITDFFRTKDATISNYIDWNYRDTEFIDFAYTHFANSKKVIVTHFLPAKECIDEKFRNGGLINKYFANDLDEYIRGLRNTTWIYGHTHEPNDFYLGDTHMVCNPKGYPHENSRFDPDKVIYV